MSDFKTAAVLKHLPASKSPAFIAFCIFTTPRKACRGFHTSVPDCDDCFPRFLHQNGQNIHCFSYFEQHEFPKWINLTNASEKEAVLESSGNTSPLCWARTLEFSRLTAPRKTARRVFFFPFREKVQTVLRVRAKNIKAKISQIKH